MFPGQLRRVTARRAKKPDVSVYFSLGPNDLRAFRFALLGTRSCRQVARSRFSARSETNAFGGLLRLPASGRVRNFRGFAILRRFQLAAVAAPNSAAKGTSFRPQLSAAALSIGQHELGSPKWVKRQLTIKDLRR